MIDTFEIGSYYIKFKSGKLISFDKHRIDCTIYYYGVLIVLLEHKGDWIPANVYGIDLYTEETIWNFKYEAGFINNIATVDNVKGIFLFSNSGQNFLVDYKNGTVIKEFWEAGK